MPSCPDDGHLGFWRHGRIYCMECGQRLEFGANGLDVPPKPAPPDEGQLPGQTLLFDLPPVERPNRRDERQPVVDAERVAHRPPPLAPGEQDHQAPP